MVTMTQESKNTKGLHGLPAAKAGQVDSSSSNIDTSAGIGVRSDTTVGGSIFWCQFLLNLPVSSKNRQVHGNPAPPQLCRCACHMTQGEQRRGTCSADN